MDSYSENERVLTECGMIQHRRTLHLVQLSFFPNNLADKSLLIRFNDTSAIQELRFTLMETGKLIRLFCPKRLFLKSTLPTISPLVAHSLR